MKIFQVFRFITPFEVFLNVLGVIAAIGAGALYPVMCLVFRDSIDAFRDWTMNNDEFIFITGEELMENASRTSLYFVYLGIGLFVLISFYTFAFVYTGQAQVNRMREQYFASVLAQNIAWFDDVGPGEVANILTSETMTIQDGISEKFGLMFYQASCLVFALGIALSQNWKLTLVLLCGVPLVIATIKVLTYYGTQVYISMMAIQSEASNIAQETISNVKTVKSLGAENELSQRYGAQLLLGTKLATQQAIVGGIGVGVFDLVIYLTYSACFYYGSILLLKDEITPGVMICVFFAALIGCFSLPSLFPAINAYNCAQVSAEKVFQPLDRVPRINKLGGQKFVMKGAINFKDVCFSYPSRSEVDVLKEFNLFVPAGSTTALVGSSGSGKTTIIKLLERFYDPKGGSIEMDGAPLQTIHLSWLRQNIGYVPQETILFPGTIRENIRMGLINTEMELLSNDKKNLLIQDACKLANAHDFIMRLPNGYDTEIGQGFELSGGQKQRLGIARAIVKNPKILLLDEATSALDSISEKMVQKALDKATKNRTTIMIAHRLATVINADQIAVMKEGRVVERGTHSQLLSEGGIYAELCSTQTLAVSNEDVKEEDLKLQENSSHSSTKAVKKIIQKQYSWWQMFQRTMRLNFPEIHLIVPALVASIASGLIYPLYSVCFARVLQTFAEGSNVEVAGKNWGLAFLFVAIGAFIFIFTSHVLFGIASEKLVQRLRVLLMSRLLRKEISFYDAESFEMIANKISSESDSLKGATGITLGTICQVMATIIGGSIVALAYGWKLGLVGMVCLPIMVLPSGTRILMSTYFYNKHKANYEASAELASQSVTAIEQVQSLGREESLVLSYKEYLRAPTADSLKSSVWAALLYGFTQCCEFFIFSIIFYYGAYLIVNEGYTLNTMFTIFVAMVFGGNGVGRVFSLALPISTAKGSANWIFNILDEEPAIQGQLQPALKDSCRVTFKNVSFSYPSRPSDLILKNIDLTIEPGQFVAFVGSSGSGKSTIIKLLQRLYDANQGSILINGMDLRMMDPTVLSSQLGIVTQQVELFNMSIKDNIVLGTNASEEQVVQACKQANLHEFIQSLPQGYSTLIGQTHQLSGGQKQRLAIARALVRNPSLLLLDEATSALDTNSEATVQQTFYECGKTIIAIAHRLASIQHADQIYVVDQGAIVENGTHDELYQKGGIYYQLAKQQQI